MAAVKPRTIANMATDALLRSELLSRRKPPGQPNTLVSSPSQLPVEFSNPVFDQLQEDAAMEVNRNPLWELAEAVHSDDASNLFTCIERCSAVKKFQLHTVTDSRDSSNNAAPQVEKIYAILQDNMAATNSHDAILIVAASFNRVAIARTMLAVDAANGVEWSIAQERALDAACTNGHIEVASVISRVNDSQVSSMLDQSLALRYYCLAGDKVHVRGILARDSPDVTIKASLWDACRHGRGDIVVLLTTNARFDPLVDGKDALQLACVNGHVEVASLLLRHDWFTTRELENVLELTTNAGHGDVVALLVQDARVNPGLNKSFTLEQYCFAGDVNRVKAALDGPSFVAAPLPARFLSAASLNGHVAIVKLLLLDPRVDPSAGKNAAIGFSSKYGHDSVVKLLLADPRVDPAADTNYAIRIACLKGHESVVKLLLADPRVDPATYNNVAIQDACLVGYGKVVKLLLADPRVDPTTENNYAIRVASHGGHKRVVKLLLADPRIDPAAFQNDAIRCASSNGHVSVAKLLLPNRRVDPSIGHPTALERASGEGHVDVVQMLLKHPKVVVTKAALVAADERDHGGIIRLLVEKQPRVLQDLIAGATTCRSRVHLRTSCVDAKRLRH
jgi:ankyrin repeat protein